jgi:hypothetical protein
MQIAQLQWCEEKPSAEQRHLGRAPAQPWESGSDGIGAREQVVREKQRPRDGGAATRECGKAWTDESLGKVGIADTVRLQEVAHAGQ